MRIFLNPDRNPYLWELADEFNISTSLVSEELKQLKKSGFLESKKTAACSIFKPTDDTPLFFELNSMVKKTLGMDRIIDSIVERLGNLDSAYLVGDYAEDKDTGIIVLVLVGDIYQTNLTDLVSKTEKYIARKISTLVVGAEEFMSMKQLFSQKPILSLWKTASNLG